VKAGWKNKPLGELCDVIGGGTPPKDRPDYYGGDIPWATVRDMRADIITSTEHSITAEAVKASATNIIPAGNVVIATRVGLGKVCLLAQDTAVNQDLRGIVPKSNKEIDIAFLFAWFKSISEQIIAEGTGATVQGVKLPFIKGLSVPLPTMEEQRRIVTLLDEAFADIATAKANAEKNLQNARTLFISHLQFGYHQQSDGWITSRIADIAKHSLGKMLDKAKNRGDLKPYLRNLNVRWFNFDLSDVQEMKFTPEESDKYTAINGDVLICEGGYPGRCAIWEDDEPIYFQKALHRVRFHNPLHSKWFVNYLYLMDQTGDLKNHFSGTGIQHFTGEALAKFTLPIPPDKQIQEVLGKANQLEAEVLRLESIYRQKLTALDDLKKSLLHQAFSGQL
jgi:type I restriction enzyme S subunit